MELDELQGKLSAAAGALADRLREDVTVKTTTELKDLSQAAAGLANAASSAAMIADADAERRANRNGGAPDG